MMEKLRRFFQGRYGIDNLTVLMLLFAVLISQFRYLWILGIALAAAAVYRTMSKNTSKRYLELQQLNKVMMNISRALQPLVGKLVMLVTRFRQRKDYAFVRCPECKKLLRLPRNKGKLQVTCPVCRHEFIKKT